MIMKVIPRGDIKIKYITAPTIHLRSQSQTYPYYIKVLNNRFKGFGGMHAAFELFFARNI